MGRLVRFDVMIYMCALQELRLNVIYPTYIVLTNLEESLLSTQVRQQTQLLLKSVMVWDIDRSDISTISLGVQVIPGLHDTIVRNM